MGVERKANGFEFTYSFFNLVTQVTVLVTMILGVTNLFYVTLNPVTAVKNIISLFSIRRGDIFSTLASTGISVLYLLFLILILKSSVSVFKGFRLTIKKNDEQDKRDWISRSYRQVHGSAFEGLLVILLSLMAGGKIIACGYIMMAVFLGNFLLGSTLHYVEENRALFKTKDVIVDFIFLTVRNLLIIGWACLSIFVFVLPSVRDVWFGVGSLFTSVGWSVQVIEALYELVAKHVLDIIICFSYLAILKELFYSVGYSSYTPSINCSYLKRVTRRILVLAGVSAVIACIMPFINGVAGKFDFSIIKTIFFTLRGHYLPILLFTGVLACFAAKPFDRPDFL